MNQEELALFIELQPRLLEYRGEWQVGDRWKDHCGIHVMVGIGTLNRMYDERGYYPNDDAIWLPQAIDPADPERIARGEKPRGLWGMITGESVYLATGILGGLLSHPWICTVMTDAKELQHAFGDTPTLALLRALKAQWEEKP